MRLWGISVFTFWCYTTVKIQMKTFKKLPTFLTNCPLNMLYCVRWLRDDTASRVSSLRRARVFSFFNKFYIQQGHSEWELFVSFLLFFFRSSWIWFDILCPRIIFLFLSSLLLTSYVFAWEIRVLSSVKMTVVRILILMFSVYISNFLNFKFCMFLESSIRIIVFTVNFLKIA